MKKENKPSSMKKYNTNSKDEHKVDLVVKFDPEVVSKICSICHQDMQRQWQRPFAVFTKNGSEPVCLTCSDQIAPEYWDMLWILYHSGNLTERLNKLIMSDEKRLKRLDRQMGEASEYPKFVEALRYRRK